MVGLHSSDPSTVFLSIWARVHGVTPNDIETALYSDRALVRILGMRRTLWVVPAEFAATVNASSTVALQDRERRKTVQMIESVGIENGEKWVDRVSALTLEAIEERGEALARELTADIPDLKEKVTFYKKDGSVLGTVGMSTRVLFLLACQGNVIRARPQGSWTSAMYRWTSTETWMGSPLEEIARDDAQSDVVRKWLHAFGPATEVDIKWWTGWPVGQVRKALQDIQAKEVQLEAGPGFLLSDDVEPVDAPDSWVSLLPSLDPTTMGWKQREWYLGDHYTRLFDRNGNAGPTVWVDGRIVGGWAQRKDGNVVYELFEDVGADAAEAIASRASGVQEWLGDTVVTPRFRSPHERELAK